MGRLILPNNDKKITKEKLTIKSEFFKVLAHPVRLCIIYKLLEQNRSNVSDMQCCIDISQSNLSQHVAKLKAGGIIVGEREGTEIYYRIKSDELHKVLATILNFSL